MKLISVTSEILHILYDWDRSEPNREHFTCRPVKEIPEREEYCGRLENRIKNGELRIYIMTSCNAMEPLGRAVLFDFNPRNRSAEFGYYLPPVHRGKGFGKLMIELLCHEIFETDALKLNKIYATTASSNLRSVRLLECLGFHLDGRLREHYWIDGERFDQLNYSMLRTDWEILQSVVNPSRVL